MALIDMQDLACVVIGAGVPDLISPRLLDAGSGVVSHRKTVHTLCGRPIRELDAGSGIKASADQANDEVARYQDDSGQS
jgi:hypothetical protein